MPFVQRVIEPKFLSCTSLFDKDGKPRITDNELEAVTNNTLSNAIRQLASLALAANDIFVELAKQLQHVTERSDSLKRKIGALEERVSYLDPKKVSVPESDICTFSRLKEHYKINHAVSTNLFDAATRPKAVQTLYEAAAKTPITIIRQMDRWRRDGHRCSKFFVCTPVLGARRRKIRNIDIETRMPSTMGDLRRWTSTEAVGDLTIAPDCPNRIVPNLAYSDGNATDGTIGSDDEALDHKLPSPEEQLQVIALKFPAEIVAVDISGRAFNRMSLQRRSLLHAEMSRLQGETLRLRTKSRKPRTRRRNTLAGTDQKEIEGALMCDNSMELVETRSAESTSVFRSKSSEPLPKKESEMKKSHFHSLKQWGKNRLKMLNKSDSLKETEEKQSNEDLNIYETVNLKRKRGLKKIIHERNPSCSSSEKSSVNLALTAPLAGLAVKLRESSVQRRLRRVGGNRDEPHSSSGNWSASSESGRASIGSEITNTTQPKSTSVTTSNNSLNLHPPGSVNSKRKFNVNTSGSSSITSEGTLTPDIHDFHEDGETSSVYSCDTEGYYTSFHMDSGLKTLKEEDAPVTPLHSTTAFGNVTANCTLTAENEYELFGKGSTSTTASSAGTVCTTLKAADSQKSLTFAPAVPERKSSLSKMALKDNLVKNALDSEFASDKTGTVKRSPCGSKSAALVGTKQSTGDLSPDSGHNTSSSPIESSNSPNGVRSGSEFEFSECSDMEGSDRIERIRAKTTINSSRIPSMCVITPPHSDDEGYNQKVFDNLETDTRTIVTVNPETGYATLETVNSKTIPSSVGEEDEIKQNRTIFKSTLLPLNNALGKLKTNFSKTDKICFKNVDDGLGDYGDYVTIADVKKNNENLPIYAETVAKTTTEYVSLNELPCNANASDSLERKRRQGARVTLSADGKVVYSSDSLRRRNGAHTTFEPGPYVKETATQSSILAQVRSISSESRPLSPQFGKVVIKASAGVASPTSEIVRVPPSTIVTPSARTTSPKPINSRGAYVHMQDARGILSSPQEKEPFYSLAEQSNAYVHWEMETLQQQTVQSADPYGYYNVDNNFYVTRGGDTYQTLPNRKPHYGSEKVRLERPITPDMNVFRNRQYSVFTNNRKPQVPLIQHYQSSGQTEPRIKEVLNESLKISPIDPRSIGEFQSSTPSSKSELKFAINLEQKLLSPKKSNMSNDELYAVIHKGKKKLNIETSSNLESSSTNPTKNASPETGYLKDKVGSRFSWSPSDGEYVDYNTNIDKISPNRDTSNYACSNRKGNKATTRLDFKKLLLQHNTKSNIASTNVKKMSAVEQLKLSKQSLQNSNGDLKILELSGSPKAIQKRFATSPLSPKSDKSKGMPKLMSPKSQWRFTNPRSDVLSSTIPEDCAEDDSPNSSSQQKHMLSSRKLDFPIDAKNILKPMQNFSQSSDKSLTASLSVAQRIRAQRAQFFGSPQSQDSSKENKIVLPSVALETAF